MGTLGPSRALGIKGLAGLLSGDPNCVHIPGLTLEEDHTYTLVVSDKDDLDAVLPVGVVRSLLARALCYRV